MSSNSRNLTIKFKLKSAEVSRTTKSSLILAKNGIFLLVNSMSPSMEDFYYGPRKPKPASKSIRDKRLDEFSAS